MPSGATPISIMDLPEDDARVLFRTAVFRGGFRADAAAHVCSDPTIAPQDVLAILERLNERSLVMLDAEQARYHLADEVRALGFEQLRQRGELADVHERHATWVSFFTRGISRRDILAYGKAVLAPLTLELDNFRAAVEWAFERSREPALAWTIVAQLLRFMQEAASSEGTRWGVRALERIPAGSDPALEADICSSIQAMRYLRPHRLRRYGERAIHLFRELGDTAGLARALRTHAVSISLYFKEETELAEALSAEALTYARESGDECELVLSLRVHALASKDPAVQHPLIMEAVAIARENGFTHLLSTTLVWLSEIEFAAGMRKEAYMHGREVWELARSLDSGDLASVTTSNLAHYAAALGECEEAHALARASLETARAAGHPRRITLSMQAFAIVSARSGDLTRAARLIGFCDARAGVIHAARDPGLTDEILHEELMALLQERIGTRELQQLFLEGRGLSEEAAAAEATAPLPAR
jgi:hypothetical protein